MTTGNINSYLYDITQSFELYNWILMKTSYLFMDNPVTAVFIGLVFFRFSIFILAFFIKLITES